ncbi:MAG: MgtC/SapB family protein, partial [Betaproteobacteria bacterium]|nr:MgtC/SapB family protein [Betaproteobacteria bacterium]
MTLSSDALVWLTALGMGLLIGLVRERAHPRPPTVAGIRTHTIVSLSSAMAWALGPWVFLLTLAAVATLVWAGYRTRAQESPGLTGEIALLATSLLAGLAHTSPALAAALAVGIAILLRAKTPVHRFSRESIREEEVTGGLMLAAS